jgi:hypothetical protein
MLMSFQLQDKTMDRVALGDYDIPVSRCGQRTQRPRREKTRKTRHLGILVLDHLGRLGLNPDGTIFVPSLSDGTILVPSKSIFLAIVFYFYHY